VIIRMTTKWYAAVLADMKTRIGTGSRTTPHRMLDIGIGTASALAANSEAVVANGVDVVGIDYDAAYIKKADAVIEKAGLRQCVRVHCCSIFEDGLASRLIQENESKFDAAYFSGSFTLLPDPAKALQVCRELVRPNGHIYITQTFQTTCGSASRSIQLNVLQHVPC
jgi:ubiquinone/menaquinone biosynthesis C-methylase UbiE